MSGFIYSPSFKISKCKWLPSPDSNTAELPIVPIDWPCSTLSPSFTNSALRRLEYTVWNPLLCSIVILNPYLGSSLIDFTVPEADALTTVVLSALISIPLWVIHSCNVLEYIKESIER